MENTARRSSGFVTRVVLIGCASALVIFLAAKHIQNVESRRAVRTGQRQQTTRDSRALPPVGAATQNAHGRAETPTNGRLVESYGKLPLRFETNRGQAAGEVKFLSRGHGYSVFLTGSEAVLALRPPSAAAGPPVSDNVWFKGLLLSPDEFGVTHGSRNSHPQSLASSAMHMKLVGANAKAPVTGLDELSGKSNYFVGNDPKQWRTNISTYAKVRYRDVYPGVDLVYHGNQGQLEYDFVVAPGADPRVIALEVRTQDLEAEALQGRAEKHAWIDADGNLVLPTEGGELRFHKPVVYQSDQASTGKTSRKYIESRYVLKEADQIGFEVAAYDAGHALIIDPILSYSSYLGGSLDDFGNAITVDSAGNIYVTGGTISSNFYTTPSAYQVIYAGDMNGGYQSVVGDVFVTKLNPSGSAVVYSTYLGGSGGDNAYAIAVDAAKNVYLTGGRIP
jgi:hypothetical protein